MSSWKTHVDFFFTILGLLKIIPLTPYAAGCVIAILP